MLVEDLIGADPDAVIVQLEAKDMVDERFALRVIFRRVKHLADEFFLDTQRSRTIEALIEGE